MVYEDLDGSGSYDMFNDLPFEGWTVNLYFDGQLVLSTTSGPDGKYVFSGLGNSTKDWWVCIDPQPGYVRTQPADGDPNAACGGNGLVQHVDSRFMTRMETNFGFMLP